MAYIIFLIGAFIHQHIYGGFKLYIDQRSKIYVLHILRVTLIEIKNKI